MNEREFENIFALMEESFPESERRTYAGQKELLADQHYRLLTETDNNNQIVAFIAAWEFPSFRFIEHFAVDPILRGSGIGGKMLTAYMIESKKPILLEVEYPDTKLAQRRIDFYERLGYHLNSFEYVQPPLHKEQDNLALKIMSYPQLLTNEEFILYRKILYRHVYKIED